MDTESRVAQIVAPEDLAKGQYVTPLSSTREHMPLFCSDDAFRGRSEPFRLTWTPKAKAPVRVVDVCLPFVLIETPKGRTRMIDLRRYRLARVADRFGRVLFDQARAAANQATPAGDGDEEDACSRFE